MSNLSTEAKKRIVEARRRAEAELKDSLSGIGESGSIDACIPHFCNFAIALFDAEAEELLADSSTAEELGQRLDSEVTPRLVSGIFPDVQGVPERMKRRFKRERRSLEIEDDGRIWEVGPVAKGEKNDGLTREEPPGFKDGDRRTAGAEIQNLFAQRGEWERFAPSTLRFRMRDGGDQSRMREVLEQAFQRRTFYWLKRAADRGASETTDESPSRQHPNAEKLRRFLQRAAAVAGERIAEADFLRVSNYSVNSRSELRRWKRGDVTPRSQVAIRFQDTLRLSPEDFWQRCQSERQSSRNRRT